MIDNERQITLVRLARSGDAHAFAELYEGIYKDLYKAALYRLGNPEDAENVVSDTVLDAYAGLDRLRDENAFRGWIFRILSNKINKVIKSYVDKREHEMAQSIEDYSEVMPSGENSTKTAEDRALIDQAFAVLSDEEKEIVTMTVFGEYDSGEIAQFMKLNRNTVRSKYSRALAKMRACLA